MGPEDGDEQIAPRSQRVVKIVVIVTLIAFAGPVVISMVLAIAR